MNRSSCVRNRGPAILRLFVFGAALCAAACGNSTGVAPPPNGAQATQGFVLAQAHAHNDYQHEQPLGDALSHGFASVEADVWILPGLGNELYVAHDFVDIRLDRTLRALYLNPLAARVAANGGRVYADDAATVQLLVDIKSDAENTYAEIADQLDDYRNMLTCVVDGELRQGAVTVVLSGNRPYDTLKAQRDRCAFYDGRSGDLGSDDPASLIPLISDSWSSQFGWTGYGAMPAEERARLAAFVAQAHAAGRRVRFWATPDAAGAAREAVWTALLDAGVDHLNTDDLAGLEAFLRGRAGD